MFTEFAIFVNETRKRLLRNARSRSYVSAVFLAAAALFAPQAQSQIVAATISDSNEHGIAINPVTNKIYIADLSGTLTVVDGLTNASTTATGTGVEYWQVAVNPVTNLVYVADRGANNIDVFAGATATNTAQRVASIPTGLSGNLFAIAVNPVTNLIYACDDGTANVLVIDGTSNHIVATIPTGFPTTAVAVNPATGIAYALSNIGTGNPGTVYVINGTSLVTSITVGNNPAALAINTALNRVYVANTDAHNVSVIDSTNAVVLTMSDNAASSPSGIAVNSITNQVYVANSGSSDTSVFTDDGVHPYTVQQVNTDPGTSVAVDTSTNIAWVASTSGSVTLIEPGVSPTTIRIVTPANTHSVSVNPVTHKVYAAHDSGGIDVIDAATNSFTTVPANAQSVANDAHAIAVNPITNRIFVANQSTGTVTVFDGANPGTILQTVSIGGTPSALEVDTVHNVVYVANSGDSQVSIIDASFNVTNVTLSPPAHSDSLAYNPVLNIVYGTSSADSVGFQFTGGAGDQTVSPYGLFGPTDPIAVAVNPALGQIYTIFGNNNSANEFNSPSGNGIGFGPCSNTGNPTALAVNAATNTVYFTCSDGTVNAFQGNDGFHVGTTFTPIGGTHPEAIAINPVTDMVYVADPYNESIYVINGATNQFVTSILIYDTDSIPAIIEPFSVAVDVASNKIYVLSVDQNFPKTPNITIIDGATNTIIGTRPLANPLGANTQLAVNPVTGVSYGLDSGPNNIGVITENVLNTACLPTHCIQTTINTLPAVPGLPPNSTDLSSPVFSFSATNGLTNGLPNPPYITGLYFQVDSQQGAWIPATSTGGGNFTGTASNLVPGFHILYAFATDGEDATSAASGLFGVQDGPLVGPIAAYGFLVAPPIALSNFFAGDFGSVQIGSTSSNFNPILINMGPVPLTYSFEITGPNNSDFQVNPTFNSGFTPCPTPSGVLAGNSACAVNITFTPSQLGPESATLTFTDDSLSIPGSTQSVGLRGTGIEAPVFSNLTPSRAIMAGSGPIIVSGVISSGGNFPVGQNVIITINSFNHTAPVGGSGTFGISIDTTGIPASPSPYPIAYSFIGSGGFGNASDSSTTLTVTSFASPDSASVAR